MEKVYSWYCYSNINGLPDNTQTYTHRRVLRLTVERNPFFRLHNLTNQEKITNKSLLCYCIQIEFTSLVRIKTLCLLYLLSVVEAGCCFLVSFSRVSSVLCLGFHVVGSCSFGETSAAWRHRESSPLQSSNSWLRYGFGTVLDPLRWLVPRWASSGPARVGGRSRENGKRSFDEFHSSRESREKREGALVARRFKQSVFWTSPKAAGPIRASVRGGAPPARLVFFKAPFMWGKITCLYPCIQTLIRFTHL